MKITVTKQIGEMSVTRSIESNSLVLDHCSNAEALVGLKLLEDLLTTLEFGPEERQAWLRVKEVV